MNRPILQASRGAALASVLAAITAIAPGCGGASGPPELAPSPPPPFAVSGTIYSTVDFVRSPLAGAEVCVLPAGSPCARTAGDGSFTLDEFPAAVDAGLLITAPGHLGAVLPFPALPSDTGADYVDSTLQILSLVTLLSDGDAAFVIEFDGGVYPPGNTGYVDFSVFDFSTNLALAGVTVATEATVGNGPVYFDDLGLPDPTLTATASLGAGVLLNVAPGDVELEFSRPGYACSIPAGIALGWVGYAEGFVARTRAPVVAGATTRVFVTCCPEDRLVGEGRFCAASPGGVAP